MTQDQKPKASETRYCVDCKYVQNVAITNPQLWLCRAPGNQHHTISNIDGKPNPRVSYLCAHVRDIHCNTLGWWEQSSLSIYAEQRKDPLSTYNLRSRSTDVAIRNMTKDDLV